MGNQNDPNKQNQKDWDNQQGNRQGGQGNQQGGNAGQQNDPNRRQQGGHERQIDDNQDDLGRDVNNPSKKSGM